MPTYTYRFDDDGSEVEVDQLISEGTYAHLPCPQCGGKYTSWPPMTRQMCTRCTWEEPYGVVAVKKVYHAPGVVLKGRGFYRTGG